MKYILSFLFLFVLLGCDGQRQSVTAIDIDTVLDWQDQKRVLFVDAREAEEYQEGHIPGAMNIPLRNINNLTPTQREKLNNAEYIVAYCLKDFRGFEVAKAMGRVLGKKTYIMKPYGLNGWRSLGLPVQQAETAEENA